MALDLILNIFVDDTSAQQKVPKTFQINLYHKKTLVKTFIYENCN